MRPWRRRLAIAGGLFVLLLVAAFLWARTALWGERLARAITEGAWPIPAVNPKIRGRLEIGHIDWGPSAVLGLVFGGAHEVRARDLKVYDPNGKLCLRIPTMTARLDVRAVLAGNFLIESAEIPEAYVLLEAVDLAEPDEVTGKTTEMGFLAAFESTLPPDPEKPGIQAEVSGVTIGRVELDLREPDWQLYLPDAALAGTLRYGGGDVGVDGMPFDVRTLEPFSGKLTILGIPFDLSETRFQRFAIAPERPTDLEAALSANTREGARLSAIGKLTSIFGPRSGVEMRLEVDDSAALLSRLSGLPVSGQVRVGSKIHGDLADPIIDIDAKGARLALDAVVLDDVTLAVRLRGRTIDATEVHARVLDGTARATGRLDLEARSYEANLELSDVNPGRIVPSLRGRLDAKAHAAGNLDDKVTAIDLDATLERTRRPLPPRLRLQGGVRLSGTTARADALTILAPGLRAQLAGSVRLDRRDLDVRITVTAERPDRLIPELEGARGLRISASVRGPVTDPAASGTVSLRSFDRGSFHLEGLSSPFEANMDGVSAPTIRARAAEGGLRASLALRGLRGRPSLDVQGEFEGLDLSALLGDAIQGTLSGGFHIDSPLDSPEGLASLRSQEVDVAGYVVRNLEGMVRIENGALRLEALDARVGDARLHAEGRLDPDGALLARLDLEDFALDRPEPVPVSGKVTGHVRVSGSLDAPRMGGQIRLSGFGLRGVQLGDGELTLTETGTGARLGGEFFERRLKVDGVLHATALSLEADVVIDGFDLTVPLPEMRDRGFVSAPAMGRIALRWDPLAGLTDADFALTSFSATHRDDTGHEIVVRNREPVRVRYRNGRAIIEPAELISPSGNLSLEGWITKDDSNVRLRGAVSLELVQFFWHRIFSKAHGEARANLWIRGPVSRPAVVGSLQLYGAVLVPHDLERAVYIPKAELDFSVEQLVLRSLILEVAGSSLHVGGTLDMTFFEPETLDLRAEGKVAAELLQLLFREHLSQATGSFALRLSAKGPWQSPRLEGNVAPDAVEIVPRRLGRTVLLSGGRLVLRPGLVVLDGIEGMIDDGEIALDGEISFRDLDVDRLDVRVLATNLPHRVPGQYDTELNLDLRLFGNVDGFELSGRVDLVDARYTRNFQVTELVLRPKVVEEADPVWRGIPLIENMRLDLDVDSTGTVAVRNNIGNVRLGVSLDVTGTPDDPRLDGEVRAEEGFFKVPLLKGRYTVDGGEVAFLASRPIEKSRVRFEGTTFVGDRLGSEHEVHLSLVGTLEEVQLRLTSPGLDPGQALSLVATGRTTEQLRQELRGDELGSGDTASPGAAAADQPIKDLTSEMFSVLVDPVSKVLRADTAALEVGSESVDVRLCWKMLGQRAEACGESNQFLAGGSRSEGRLELRIDEGLSAVFKGERLAQGQDTLDRELNRARLQLRYRFRLP